MVSSVNFHGQFYLQLLLPYQTKEGLDGVYVFKLNYCSLECNMTLASLHEGHQRGWKARNSNKVIKMNEISTSDGLTCFMAKDNYQFQLVKLRWGNLM